MAGTAPGGGAFHGLVTPSPILPQLWSLIVPNSWALV
jgi:hypothetical protein